MTDLWVEATHDFEREDSDRQLIAAREQVADLWQFLASASNQDDFENRKALIADRLDNAAQGETRQRLEAALDRDFEVVLSQRPKGRTAADKTAYDLFDFDDAVCRETIKKLQAVDGYDEGAVLEAIKGIGYRNFQVLDEKPGYFGNYYDADWHWKLRRARNSADGFFETLNITAKKTSALSWTTVGADFDQGTIQKAIAGLQWQDATGVTSLPMMPGMGIKEVIKEFKIPNVKRFAYRGGEFEAQDPDGGPSDVGYYSLYGIEALYTNGLARIYVVDRGSMLTPVASELVTASKKTAANVVGDACPGRDAQAGATHSPGGGKPATPPFKCVFCQQTIKAASTESSKTAERHTDSTTGIVGEWRVDVAGVGESTWSNNAVTWDTQEEAKRASSDLMSRWMGADMARVVPSSTPKNETIDPSDPYIVENWRKSGSRRTAEETPEKTSTCSKCGRSLEYFSDPEDDEARNWQDTTDGSSYCPADGGDHSPTTTASRRTSARNLECSNCGNRFVTENQWKTQCPRCGSAEVKNTDPYGMANWGAKTAAEGDTECTNCGTFFDQAEVKARDNIPGGATTEFCTQNCYDEYYGPDPTALDVYEGRKVDGRRRSARRHPFGRKTALAPVPTTTMLIDGRDITVYAAPSSTGQPRNRWIAVEIMTTQDVGHEWFGGADRDAVSRKVGRGPWRVIDTTQYEWTPTPAWKMLGSKTAAAILDEDPENNTMTTAQGVWTMEYDSESMKRMKESEDYEPWYPDFQEQAGWSQPHHYKLTGPNGQVHEFSAQGDSVAGPWYSAWEQARSIVSRASRKTAEFIPGGILNEEQANTTPLWMAEDALADEDSDGEEGERKRERIRIDIQNIKSLQGDRAYEGSRKQGYGGTYAGYGWIVTQESGEMTDAEWDRVDNQGQRVVPKDQIEVHVIGPSNIHPKVQEALEAGKGGVFALWSDDGIRDCKGRWIEDATTVKGVDVSEIDTGWGGAGDPLGDYGGNAGSTHLTDGSGQIIIGVRKTAEFPAKKEEEAPPKGEAPAEEEEAPDPAKNGNRPEPWPEAACGETDEGTDTFCIRDAGHPDDGHQFRSRFWIEQKMDDAGLTVSQEPAPEEIPEIPEEQAPAEEAKPKGEVPPQFKKKTSRPKADLSRVAEDEPRICQDCGYPLNEPTPDADCMKHPERTAMRKGAPFADYKDFAECVSKNSDKDDPDAYCGYIKHKVEDTKESILIASALLPRLTNADFEQAIEELGERVSVR